MSRRSKTKEERFNAAGNTGDVLSVFLKVAPWSATLQSSSAEACAMSALGMKRTSRSEALTLAF